MRIVIIFTMFLHPPSRPQTRGSEAPAGRPWQGYADTVGITHPRRARRPSSRPQRQLGPAGDAGARSRAGPEWPVAGPGSKTRKVRLPPHPRQAQDSLRASEGKLFGHFEPAHPTCLPRASSYSVQPFDLAAAILPRGRLVQSYRQKALAYFMIRPALPTMFTVSMAVGSALGRRS